MVNVHTLISNASNSFLSSFVSVLGFSWPLWFFGYYLAALHACWFILKWGWSEGTIRSVYKMTDRKPIQKETSLPNQNSVFRKGSLSQVIHVFWDHCLNQYFCIISTYLSILFVLVRKKRTIAPLKIFLTFEKSSLLVVVQTQRQEVRLDTVGWRHSVRVWMDAIAVKIFSEKHIIQGERQKQQQTQA